MDVLLHIDIIAQYFKNKLSVDIFNEELILIKNFFEKTDDNFKIILTQNIIQNVKKSLKNNPLLLEVFQLTLSRLIDERGNNSYFNLETEKDKIFKELSEQNTSDCLFKISKKDIDVSDTIILEKRSKPNIHWWKSELVSNGKFTLRYHDFNDNNEIRTFFKEIFSSCKYTDFHIFDRYKNVNKHTHFLSVKKKENIKIKYYTFNKDLKKVFNYFRHNIEIYITEDKNLLHERKVIFQHFFLEADEDFGNIRKNRTTWKIDLSYSKKLCEKQMEKINEFKKYTNS